MKPRAFLRAYLLGAVLAYPISGLIFSALAAYFAVILMDFRRFPITLEFEYWKSLQPLFLPAYLAGAVQGGVIGWYAMRIAT